MVYPTVVKAYYDTPEGQIHYRYLHAPVKDESKSPILFLHMSAASSHYYEKLMQLCAAEGYDCFAPDMPGFGRSFDLPYQPAGISYYAEAFMILIKQLGISKFHVLGHHSGASIATEMAVLHPDQVLSLCISSPALLTPEEQEGFRKTELTPYNKPTRDGTHWSKSWDFINSENPWDLDQLQDLTLDATRAWQGRIQIYTCVFSQPLIEVLAQVKCQVLALSSIRGVLYKYMPKVKEAQPDATVQIVEGGDFEVIRDAEGVCKNLLQFIRGLQGEVPIVLMEKQEIIMETPVQTV